MNRVNYNREFETSFEEIMDVINDMPFAKKIVNDLKLSKQQILDSYDKILFCASQNEVCQNCKGLSDCKKSKKGHIHTLSFGIDDELAETIGICEFYREYDKKDTNFLYSNYDKESILRFKDYAKFGGICASMPHEFLMVYKALFNKISTKGCYLKIEGTKKRKDFVVGLVSTLLNEYECSLLKVSSFISDLKSTFNTKNSNYDEIINSVYTSQVLVIDDLGGESVTAWSRDDVLLPLLNYRLDNNLTTIFISEFDKNQLPLIYALKNDELKTKKFLSRIDELII